MAHAALATVITLRSHPAWLAAQECARERSESMRRHPSFLARKLAAAEGGRRPNEGHRMFSIEWRRSRIASAAGRASWTSALPSPRMLRRACRPRVGPPSAMEICFLAGIFGRLC
jgi:hypothetical protein